MSSTIGSQHLLRAAVEQAASHIDPHVRGCLALPEDVQVDWRSPLAEQGYREYRDGEALDQLRLPLKSQLKEFWPWRGPVWDGLGRTSAGQVLLVEAKAHIPELASSGTKAGGASLSKIEAAFAAVRAEIAPRSSATWTSTFYQYANRLAFLFLLRKNGVDARLLHVLFLNATDVHGPSTPEEWKGALVLLRASLGLQNHKLKPFVHELFIDARSVQIPQVPIEV